MRISLRPSCCEPFSRKPLLSERTGVFSASGLPHLSSVDGAGAELSADLPSHPHPPRTRTKRRDRCVRPAGTVRNRAASRREAFLSPEIVLMRPPPPVLPEEVCSGSACRLLPESGLGERLFRGARQEGGATLGALIDAAEQSLGQSYVHPHCAVRGPGTLTRKATASAIRGSAMIVSKKLGTGNASPSSTIPPT